MDTNLTIIICVICFTILIITMIVTLCIFKIISENNERYYSTQQYKLRIEENIRIEELKYQQPKREG